MQIPSRKRSTQIHDYMESCGTFKPIGTSEYDLCCFYQVGQMEDFPEFPKPREPVMNDDVCCLLEKACELGQPKLVVALSQDVATATALLQDLHHHVSLQWLKMETDMEAGDGSGQKLFFCQFCQYSGSNDLSYLNHIMCMHYCANFGCGKCLDTVFKSRQKLSQHMKRCKGLVVDSAGKKPPKHVKEMSKTSSSNKKKKHKSKQSQDYSPPGSQTHPLPSSQTSSQKSSCCSGCTSKKDPATATPQKLHSGSTSSKHSSEKCLGSKTSSEKDKKKHNSDKHRKM